MRRIEINQIGGFRLGNADDKDAATGCTVIICENGAVGGVDVRGGAPLTSGTDLLRSGNSQKINAVVLSGGSAFGLEACAGVVRYLSANGIGNKMPGGDSVPFVCGASLYDLEVGSSEAFPDVKMGKRACANAYKNVFGNGNNGAGTGASCGKCLGMGRAMKTGLGTYAVGDDFLQIGAVSAVNAAGDIAGGSGKLIAGLRSKDGSSIIGTVRAMREKVHNEYTEGWESEPVPKHSAHEASRAFAAEKSNNHEMNDIAEAMMAAFNSSNNDGHSSEAGVQKSAGAQKPAGAVRAEAKKEGSAAAYVEAFKMKALAKAQQAARSGHADKEDQTVLSAGEQAIKKSDDLIGRHNADEPDIDKYFQESAAKSDPLTSRDAKGSNADPAAGRYGNAGTSRVEKHASAGIRNYEEIVDEENDDDDLGYDIPFNTVISCVITNAKLSRAQANKLASILHDAYARAIKPAHTTMDGDTIFVLATGQQNVNFDAFAALATDVLQYAVIDGALSARKAYGLPAARDFK